MKLALAKLTRIGSISAIALTLGLTACHHGDRTMGQAFNDKMTAHDVKKAMAKSPIYKFEDVNANVFDGNVQLTGFVETQQQREQAAKIAAGVPGVREVVNDIMLKPTPTGRAAIKDNGTRQINPGNNPAVSPSGAYNSNLNNSSNTNTNSNQ